MIKYKLITPESKLARIDWKNIEEKDKYIFDKYGPFDLKRSERWIRSKGKDEEILDYGDYLIYRSLYRNYREVCKKFRRSRDLHVHHIMENDDSRDYNSKYYYRWGVENRVMKHSVFLTRVQHALIHGYKVRSASKEDFDKYYNKDAKRGLSNDKTIEVLRRNYYNNDKMVKKGDKLSDAARKKISDGTIKFFESEDNRKKCAWTTGMRGEGCPSYGMVQDAFYKEMMVECNRLRRIGDTNGLIDHYKYMIDNGKRNCIGYYKKRLKELL